jgi:hypothetical protein
MNRAVSCVEKTKRRHGARRRGARVTGQDTRIAEFRKEGRWNQPYYHLAKGI